MDFSLDAIEDELVILDTTKANQSTVLGCCNGITYNSTTGVFTFDFVDGTSLTADLNIEKIPVSFSMDEDGVITMTTSDGSQYTADVGALIKTYTFEDSDEINFETTTDSSGNKTVSATINTGSISEDKLETDFLANCRTAAQTAGAASTSASGSAATATAKSLASEGYAVGTQDGVPVTQGSPYYHNNAKWYCEQGGGGGGTTDYTDLENKPQINSVELSGNKTLSALGIPTSLSAQSDVSISSPSNGQELTYNSTSGKWENTTPETATVLTGTLTAGQTQITFTNAKITSDCLVDIYVEHGAAVPTEYDDSTPGSITLTFEAQTTNLGIKLVIN